MGRDVHRCVAKLTRVTGVKSGQAQAPGATRRVSPPGHSSTVIAKMPVVAPGAVDVQEPRREPTSRMPSFSTTRSELVFSGRMRDLDPVQPGAEKQWSIAIATAQRHDPAAGEPLVDPVADRGELRRAAHDVVDRHLAGELAVDLDRERHRRVLAGLPAQPADQRPEGRRAARRTRRARSRPSGFSQAALRTADRHARPARRRWLERPQRDRRRGVSVTGHAGQWSLPTICSTACTSSGSSTARPSFTPPREPGRLTTRQSPTTPASPRDSAAVGTPLATPCAADRLGDAGHLAVEQRPGHLGGPVGRGEAGAAGGEHDAGRRRDRGARSPRPPARRRARRPGVDRRSPSSCRASTISGPVVSS